VLSDGGLRCWGHGVALGYADTEDIGDDEHPFEAGDVSTGGFIRQVTTGQDFTCALYAAGNVRCWGRNTSGQLGYGHRNSLFGRGNTPDRLPDVELNGEAVQLVAGDFHACALLASGDVRCWGDNSHFQLATGDSEDVGDDEVPGSRSSVQVGGPVVAVAAATNHTCAVVDGGFVRCWGAPVAAPLGYGPGPGLYVGDDETPAQAGDINVGGSVLAIETGTDHTCALMASGGVRCWGSGRKDETTFRGVLGYEEKESIGDDESPASAGDVAIGGVAVALAGAGRSRCALLDDGPVRCWGRGNTGSLGLGNLEDVGDDETPAEVPVVPLDGPVRQLARSAAASHVCVLMAAGDVRCWGRNDDGQLGLGHTAGVGDDETAGSVSAVRVLE
jgi:alpha-tubulin suppressor-like RCC1 family protein